MLMAFTSLPGFVTLVFRGMPTVWRGRHRLIFCWLVFMQAVHPGRHTLEEMARWTPATITAWRFGRLLKAAYWNVHLLVHWLAQDLLAREVLSNSEVWVFCGYSLPEYDLDIRNLLARSASGRVTKVCVCDINPAPVCEKLSVILNNGKHTVQLCEYTGITKEFDKEHARKLVTAITSA